MSDTFDASHAIDSSLTTPEATQYRWAATNKARTETGTNTVALSVRQRKLLMLLAIPQTAAVLAERSNTPLPDVEAALSRFAALGLAESDAPRVASRTATTVDRATGVRSTPAAAQVRRSSSTRLPLALGGAALVAAGLAIWFFSRPATQPITPAPTLASVATAPTPAATTPQAAPALPSAPEIAISPSSPAGPTLNATAGAETSAQRAAVTATAAKEAAAKAAAKDVTQAATKSAPTPAASVEPRTSATPASVAALPPPVTSAAPVAAPVAASVAAPPTVTAALPPAVTTAQPAPTPAPATATPSPAAATSATAAPARSAAPVAAREGRLLERVEPVYPRNVQYENGTVRARLSVNAAGAVTGVEIMSSNPPRVFDRSVSTALAQWKYEATGEASSKLVEVSFQR
ncbi:MAG TPA: TonB family protein [Casimicrobium sp.]|nr:TonB family protein [Casimicrobium sp.]